MEDDLTYQQENRYISKELKGCPECNKPRISFGWCKKCEANSMKENFFIGYQEIMRFDELIRCIQLNAT